jgi:hypothetical protein
MNSSCITEPTTAAFEARQEIARRASHFTAQRFLPVNYYRIRKRLAIPLPVSGPLPQGHSVRAFFSSYSWLIWLFWALEDRVIALGEFVNQTGDIAARSAVEADLSALAAWETYRELAYPDLTYAHAVRILSTAITRWDWIEDARRTVLRDALWRAVDEALPLSDRVYGRFDSKAVLLATSQPHEHLHNILLIGTCAVAWAARIVEHPASTEVNARAAVVLSAMLDSRRRGFTEGVSYDGYVLDFLADWLTVLDPATRDEILLHPGFIGLVEQAIDLAVPGDVMNTAPLGDVEPVEMPFVWSALAKLQVWQSNPRVGWALSQCTLSQLRADGLLALGCLPDHVVQASTVQSPMILNSALVLRSGHSADGVAVAMGLSNSPMGHIAGG